MVSKITGVIALAAASTASAQYGFGGNYGGFGGYGRGGFGGYGGIGGGIGGYNGLYGGVGNVGLGGVYGVQVGNVQTLGNVQTVGTVGGAYGLPSEFNEYVMDQPTVNGVNGQFASVPPGTDINPNVATEYAHQLYEHGKALLNRVKAELGGRLDGPAQVRRPVLIPAGYEPHSDMDILYAELFALARCLSPHFFGRAQTSGNFDNDFFRGPADFPTPTPATVDECFRDEGEAWIEDSLKSFITSEVKGMLAFIKQNPTAPLVQIPTLANMWRTHSRAEDKALVETVLAAHRLYEAMIREAFKNIDAPGLGWGVTPDWDNLLASPFAASEFGFPPGFNAAGFDEEAPNDNSDSAEWIFDYLSLQIMYCRSDVESRFSRNFYDHWAQGPDAGRFTPEQSRQDCLSKFVDDWYFDEADDFTFALLHSAAHFIRPEQEVIVGEIAPIGAVIDTVAAEQFPGYTWDAATSTFIAESALPVAAAAAPMVTFDQQQVNQFAGFGQQVLPQQQFNQFAGFGQQVLPALGQQQVFGGFN
jgi:hypothetical protein